MMQNWFWIEIAAWVYVGDILCSFVLCQICIFMPRGTSFKNSRVPLWSTAQPRLAGNIKERRLVLDFYTYLSSFGLQSSRCLRSPLLSDQNGLGSLRRVASKKIKNEVSLDLKGHRHAKNDNYFFMRCDLLKCQDAIKLTFSLKPRS